MLTLEQIEKLMDINKKNLWFAIKAGYAEKIKDLKTQRDVLYITWVEALNAELKRKRAG